MINVTKDILKEVYKARPRNARKYDYGFLTIIGGSEFYSGSPALSAFAAFKAGVDMIRVIAPKRAADIIASFSPDLAAYPLLGSHITKENVATLISMTEFAKEVSRGKTAVVIGGGLGRTEDTQEAVVEYLSQIEVPVVIDADGIRAIAKNKEVIAGKPFLLTPHAGEFYILTGKMVEGLTDQERIKIVVDEAAKLRTTIMLKGPLDIISNGREVATNETGSGFMTKGGMGDTLAGIAGALIARGIDPFAAAQAAAYINGVAGEKAAKKYGESVMASDLINAIAEVIS